MVSNKGKSNRRFEEEHKQNEIAALNPGGINVINIIYMMKIRHNLPHSILNSEKLKLSPQLQTQGILATI